MTDLTPFVKALQDLDALRQLEQASKLFNHMETALKPLAQISSASQLCSQVSTASKLIDQLAVLPARLEQANAFRSLESQFAALQAQSLRINELGNLFQNVASQLDQLSNIATIHNNLEALSTFLQRLNVPNESKLVDVLSGVEKQDYEQKLRESFDEIDAEQEPSHDLLADMTANQAKRLSEIIFKLLVVYSVFQQIFGLPTLPELFDEISIETEAKSNLDPQIKPCHSLGCAPQKTDTNNGKQPPNADRSPKNDSDTIVPSSAMRLRKGHQETDEP